jgi:Zn-dependent peptidase ImmA (M78 family)
LGHYVLHKKSYDELTFQSADDYANWRNSIPAEEISWFETQGEWFASQLLVPAKQLLDVCWSYIAIEIADYFDVNPPVIENRIKKENIPTKISILG